MRDRKNGGRGPALLTAATLALIFAVPAGMALAQQAGGGQPPPRIGPEWDWRKHQPTPAEIEARERAAGRQPSPNAADSREVDRLYRELTGQNPAAVPPASPRAADRR